MKFTPTQKAVCLLAALVGSLASPSHAQQKMAIPAYFYPGSLWTQATASAPTVDIMIMNPNSGPDTYINSDYVAEVQAAQARGVTILGYVHTTYGARDSQVVMAEINAYFQWYGVDGIFLDEVASAPNLISYYKPFYDSVHSLGKMVMLNPGVYPDEGYMAVGDIVVVFESDFNNYRNAAPPSWIYNYPPNRFYHIVYETATATDMQQAVLWSRQWNAGYLFVTDDVLDNPFDTLPTYWSSEISLLGDGDLPPINTPPQISPIDDQRLNNISSVTLYFTVTDAETAASALTVTAASSNPVLLPSSNIALGGSGANRSITVTAAYNETGTATVTVSVSDGSATADESFNVTVKNHSNQGKPRIHRGG